MYDDRYVKRTLLKEQIHSRHLGAPRDIKIYLPPGYDELISYPVLYCQDGEDFFNFGRVATHANKLILDEGMEPIVIVGVDVDKRARTSEYSPEGDRFASYCRFFAEELIPYVESRLPLRSEADERVLAGDSLGATVSLHLALAYPELFRNVIALSGAFFPSTYEYAERQSNLSGLNMYMVIGLQEHAVQTDRGTFDFLEMNRKLRKLLADKHAGLHYEEKPGKHVWGFWQNELPEALRYFWG